MTHTPPNDQTIVDEYFKLRTNRRRSRLAWLFGMIATYGLTPDALEGFSWGPEASIYIQGKRRPVSPVHPQWAIIFRLKEEQPRNWQDCLQSLSEQLYCAMAYQKGGRKHHRPSAIASNAETFVSIRQAASESTPTSCRCFLTATTFQR